MEEATASLKRKAVPDTVVIDDPTTKQSISLLDDEPSAAAPSTSSAFASGSASAPTTPTASKPAAAPASSVPVAVSVFGVSDRGKKNYQQDTKVIIENVHELKQFDALPASVRMSYWSVIDGHGGQFVMEYLRDTLHVNVLSQLAKQIAEYKLSPPPTTHSAAGAPVSPAAASLAVAACDDAALIRRVWLESFKQTDRDLLSRCATAKADDGAVVVAALLLHDTCWVAFTGDCRAVLARTKKVKPPKASKKQKLAAASASAPTTPTDTKSNSAAAATGTIPVLEVTSVAVSTEHTPILLAERERIEKAGGSVADGRVNGQLAVSRSFGDRAYKNCGVIATPGIAKFTASADTQFLLLACDGLFSVMTADTAVQFVAAALRDERQYQSDNPTRATDLKSKQRTESAEHEIVRKVATKLVREAVTVLNARDNVTAILVVFEHPIAAAAPAPPVAAAASASTIVGGSTKL